MVDRSLGTKRSPLDSSVNYRSGSIGWPIYRQGSPPASVASGASGESFSRVETDSSDWYVREPPRVLLDAGPHKAADH